MTNDQYSKIAGGGVTTEGPAVGRKRVIWLHTQPEHYFNCMMDDLARGKGYEVAGMGGALHADHYEWVAAFSYRGQGWYKENAQPRVAETIFLTPLQGKEKAVPTLRGAFHADWQRELLGVQPAVMIVSGYLYQTHRDVIAECARRGIPVAMWSDSNLRSQRGRGFKARVKRRLKKAWLAKLIRQCDLQLTANRLGMGYWRYYGAPRRKIVKCPCYSDYGRIDAARGRSRAELMGRIGLAEGDRMLFSAARLVPAKGLDLMIRAFKRSGLAERGWKYVIAGMGELEGELKALAGDAVGKSIFFIGFQQPSENLALMAQAEMLVLPSRYEPHGIVVAESLAAGTPVLASDVVGAVPDLVKEGTSGLVFRSEDEDALLAKLEWVGEDLARVRGMRAGARDMFEAWYRVTSPMIVVPAAVERMLTSHKVTGGAR